MFRREGSDHADKLFRAFREEAFHANKGVIDKTARVAMKHGRASALAKVAWWFYKKQEETMHIAVLGAKFVRQYASITEEQRTQEEMQTFYDFVLEAIEVPAELSAEISRVLYCLALGEKFGAGQDRHQLSESLSRLISRRAKEEDYRSAIAEELEKETTTKLCTLVSIERLMTMWEKNRKQAGKGNGNGNGNGGAKKGGNGSGNTNGRADPKRKPKSETRCRFTVDCWQLGDCGWLHTQEEQRVYAKKKKANMMAAKKAKAAGGVDLTNED
jgi:hypothetical protein